MSDPLAGKRDAINAGELDHLIWPDEDEGCPVKRGDIFKLRSCHLEITRIHRVGNGTNGWFWRAEFTRLHRDRVHILGATGGYVSSGSHAMKAQDDPRAATVDRVNPADRTQQHKAEGEPPEPEGVAPHEIGVHTGDKQARRRYEQEIVQAKIAHEQQPLEVRLARVRQIAKHRHMDISSRERVIERHLQKLERDVLDTAA